jgi:hypothetical protein
MSRQLVTARRKQLLDHLYDAERVFTTLSSPLYKITNKIINSKDLYIAYSTQYPGKISFAPSKEYKYDIVHRQMTTFGRIVRRQLEKDEVFDIKDSDLDKIQQYLLFKLGIIKHYKIGVKILTGYDILDAYREGVGSRSCMTGNSQSKYLDLYSSNPERIALLVVTTIQGTFRALRWLLDNEKYVYDRPYPEFNWSYNTLVELAVNNGYVRGYIPVICPGNTSYFRSNLTRDEYSKQFAEFNKDLKVTVARPKYLPYRDTFKWFKFYFKKKHMELTVDNLPGFYKYEEVLDIRDAIRYYNQWKNGSSTW